MANWFVPFRQLQRREALVGQRVNERTNQSRPHSLTCANLTYVNIQFTQPTSTSHLLNLASCFVSLPLSVSLFFLAAPGPFPRVCLLSSRSVSLLVAVLRWRSYVFCFCQEQSGWFFQVHIYIYAGYFALGAKMLVSQYLVQFGSVHVSGAKHFVFDNFLSDG